MNKTRQETYSKCEYCENKVSQIRISEDEGLDFCNECDMVIEGHTIDGFDIE